MNKKWIGLFLIVSLIVGSGSVFGAEKTIPLAKGALAVGADGLLVEVHHDPSHALSDGMQSIYPKQFAELMKEIDRLKARL